MIYLIFECLALNRAVSISDEFDSYAWVKPADLADYDLNDATKITLRHRGLLP